MVEAGEIYHPLRWTPAEAFQLLTDVPRLEAAGVIVRVPGAWRANRPPRPQVTATVGGKPPSGLGTDALLDFKMDVTLDGEPLTSAEIEQLLAASNGLHLVRGRWVEVDRDRLSRMLDEFRAVETAAAKDGLSFAEAMRLLAGAHVPGDIVAATRARLVTRRRRAVAGEDARRPSRSGPAGAPRSRRRAEGDVAALSAGRRALAASALQPRPRRLPRRRHGSRQDDAGAGAAAGAASACGR